jgi:hypothetical protein
MAYGGVMRRVLMVAMAAACCAAAMAQVGVEDTSDRMKPIPPPVDPAPFSVNSSQSQPSRSIEFRAAGAMTQTDRLVMADAEASIAEHAGVSGFELEQGTWSATQIVCPALPHHVFLRYTRNNGTGDVTVFSASIPRDGDGRVRIIPIQRRGYSLFSPAPINALTISAFNHIRAEEPDGQRADNWLGNGLCYAALAGGHPRIPDPDRTPELGKPIPALSAVLDVWGGGETIRFADEAAAPHPMLWTMEFTRNGRLTKATHTPAALYGEKPVPLTSAVTTRRPVPQESSVTMKPVPPPAVAAFQPVVKGTPGVFRPVPTQQASTH